MMYTVNLRALMTTIRQLCDKALLDCSSLNPNIRPLQYSRLRKILSLYNSPQKKNSSNSLKKDTNSPGHKVRAPETDSAHRCWLSHFSIFSAMHSRVPLL